KIDNCDPAGRREFSLTLLFSAVYARCAPAWSGPDTRRMGRIAPWLARKTRTTRPLPEKCQTRETLSRPLRISSVAPTKWWGRAPTIGFISFRPLVQTELRSFETLVRPRRTPAVLRSWYALESLLSGARAVVHLSSFNPP